MLNETIINRRYVSYNVFSVIKLKNKYGFRVKLFFNDGSEEIRQFGGHKKKKDAEIERNKKIVQLENHTFVVIPRIKFKDYITYWLEKVMRPNITYNSYISYRNIVQNYAIPYFENLYLETINAGHIQKFYNTTTEKYESIGRLAKVVITTAMQYAKDKNLISIDPTIDIELPKNIKKKKYRTLEIDKDKVLDLEQVKILIRASKETPIYLHIIFAVLMGLRKQEISGLKFSDVDFVNKKIHIQRQLGVNPKKSKEECKPKTYTKQEIKLKTYSSDRVLDIPDLVFEAILEAKSRYEKNRSRRINDKTNPFFDGNYICCSTYGKPRSKGFITPYYKKLLKDNGLPDIKFHDLRHTYTTLLLKNNKNLKAISEILGHASTIITSTVYFDKDKIVIDCNEELNNFIEKVIIKTNYNDDNIITDLYTPSIFSEFLREL